ncbi:hypothetical protein ACSSS7_001010 [Eimeria intestinalis]
MVEKVGVHLSTCCTPLLLLSAANSWRPSLLLLTSLCNLQFTSTCSSSSSKWGWSFPRGTALLSHLLKATAELQHVMPPPLPHQEQQHQQQQQQQQGMQEERPPSSAALGLRLVEATLPSFLHTLTRCCFAGILDDVALEFSAPLGGPQAVEGPLEASRLGAPKRLLLLPKPLASLGPLVERCLTLQLLLQQCDSKVAGAARLLPQQQQHHSDGSSNSNSNAIDCVDNSTPMNPEEISDSLFGAPGALGFSAFFDRVRHSDLQATPALRDITSSSSSSSEDGLSAMYEELGLHGLTDTLRRQNLCFAAGIRRLQQLAAEKNLHLPHVSNLQPQQKQQQNLHLPHLLLFEDSHTAQTLRLQLLQRLEQHAAEERQKPKYTFVTPRRAAGAERDVCAAGAPTATTAAAAAGAEAALSIDIEQLLQSLLGALPVSHPPANPQQKEQPPQQQQQQQHLLHIACRVRRAGPHRVATDAAAAADELIQRIDFLPSAPSPLQLFLNPGLRSLWVVSLQPVREQYSAVFRFLIRLDAALSCLADCWMLRQKQQQQQQLQQQQRFATRALQLQQRLQHFLRSVWDFVLTEAVEAEWLNFRRQVAAAAAATTVPSTSPAAPAAEAEAAEVEAAEAAAAEAAAKGKQHASFFALVEAHARCVESIYTRCLLSERLAPLRRKVEVIIQCCWKLRSLMLRQQQQQQQQDEQQQDEQQLRRQIVMASLSRSLSLATASSALPGQTAEASRTATAAAAAGSELECLYFDYERSSSAFLRALLVLQPLQVLSPLLLRLNFNGVLGREAGSQRWF